MSIIAKTRTLNSAMSDYDYDPQECPAYPGIQRGTINFDQEQDQTLVGQIRFLFSNLLEAIAAIASDGVFQQRYFIYNVLQKVSQSLTEVCETMDNAYEIDDTRDPKYIFKSLRSDVKNVCDHALVFTQECIKAWEAHYDEDIDIFDFVAIAEKSSEARYKCLIQIKDNIQRRNEYNPHVAELLASPSDLDVGIYEQLDLYTKLYGYLIEYLHAPASYDRYLINSSDVQTRIIRRNWFGVGALFQVIVGRSANNTGLTYCKMLVSELDEVSSQLNNLSRAFEGIKFPERREFNQATNLQIHTIKVCDALSTFSNEFFALYQEYLSLYAKIEGPIERDELEMEIDLYSGMLKAVATSAQSRQDLVEDYSFNGTRVAEHASDDYKTLVSLNKEILRRLQTFFGGVLGGIEEQLDMID